METGDAAEDTESGPDARTESVAEIRTESVDENRTESVADTSTESIAKIRTESVDETRKESVDEARTLICALCMKSFGNKKELREHYRCVHKSSLVKTEAKQRRMERKVNRHLCGLCGKHFGDQWTLSHHQKTVHSDSREHKCGECDKAFLSNKDRVRHHRGVHLRERITFPGSGDRPRRRTSVTAPPSTSSDKLTKLPNILKYSKSEKKTLNVIPPVICKPEFSSSKLSSVVRVIGLEKSQKNSTEKLKIESSGLGVTDQQPMFQLENLENLQLVVPDPAEEQGEPRIIIPETGIRLTIAGAGESDIASHKILHLIPENSVNQQSENSKQVNSHSSSEPELSLYRKESPAESSHLFSVKDNRVAGAHFNCPSCSKLFISKDFLDKHISSFHSEISPFSISYINTLGDLASEQSLGSIDDIEIDSLNNGSASASLKKDGLDVLLSNTSAKAEKVSDFPCNSCSERFCSKQALQRHKKSSHKKRQVFRCEDCESVFTSNQTLKAHVQSVHEGIKKVCSMCLKPVVDLTRHIRDQHKNGDKREYHCDTCGCTFRTNFSLQRHKENVHLKLKAWTCDLCEKSFGEKRDMNRHKHAVHFGIKNKLSVWSCPECHIQFKLRREYDDHKASYHSQLSEQQIVKFLNSEMETKSKQKFQMSSFDIL